MTALHTATEARELAHREADGVEVTLLWHPAGDFVTVTVVDSRGGDQFELVLEDGDRALDVFHHPYAHAARRGLDVGVGAPERDLAAAA
jgi:hypothetical protein